MAKSNASHVLTDPACVLGSAPWNILSIYQTVLDDIPEIAIVSAALRRDDWLTAINNSNEERFVALPALAYDYN